MDKFSYASYLAHHGIKGQKWGVRRFQNRDGTRTAAGKKRYSDSSLADRENSNRSVGKKTSAKAFVESHSSGSAGLTYEQEVQVIQIASIGIGILARYGISKLATKVIRNSRKKELEERMKTKDIPSLDECPKLKKKVPASESVKVVNPDYPSAGTTMNCTFCTTAMALREKGYDVRAAKTDYGWWSEDLFKSTFNSPTNRMKKARKGSDVLNELDKNPDGAYGNLGVQWKLGGGHSVFWKKENGKVRIYDGQDGTEITGSSDKLNTFLNGIKPSKTEYNRFDNTDPTEYALAIVGKLEKKG